MTNSMIIVVVVAFSVVTASLIMWVVKPTAWLFHLLEEHEETMRKMRASRKRREQK